MTELRVEVDPTSLRLLVAAAKAEADGGELIRNLAGELRQAVEPGAALARSAILSMPSGGLTRGTSLRASVAAGVRTRVRLGQREASVRVTASKRGMPRDFANAPKRLNATRGWRHQVFGTDRWVVQRGRPDWFDGSMRARHAAARRGVEAAMRRMAERISARTQSR